MPSYRVKALENTQSILCGLFLVCEHFCSGRTASHRTALNFRGIFVLWDAGGLTPAKEKRAKSTEKAGCPTCVPLLIDANEKTRRSLVLSCALTGTILCRFARGGKNPSGKNFVFATSPNEGRQDSLRQTHLAPLIGADSPRRGEMSPKATEWGEGLAAAEPLTEGFAHAALSVFFARRICRTTIAPTTTMPITSVTVPGSTRHSPPAAERILRYQGMLPR